MENSTSVTNGSSELISTDTLYQFVWFMEKNVNDFLKAYWMGFLIPINLINNAIVLWVFLLSPLVRRDTTSSVRVYYIAIALADITSSLSNHTMYCLSMKFLL